MRDPKRIPRILEKLEKVWNNPDGTYDLRLGQLVSNINSTVYPGSIDVFYIEDDKLEAELDRQLEELC